MCVVFLLGRLMVCCLLWVVECWLFFPLFLLLVGCCWLLAVCCSLVGVVGCGVLVAVCCLWCVVCCLLFVVCVVCGRLPCAVVRCLLSDV